MNSFWTLVIMGDMSIKRMWTNTEKATAFLKENRSAKIYRTSEYQEAVYIESSDGNDCILWQDVSELKLS